MESRRWPVRNARRVTLADESLCRGPTVGAVRYSVVEGVSIECFPLRLV
jgi:hypothetical protein